MDHQHTIKRKAVMGALVHWYKPHLINIFIFPDQNRALKCLCVQFPSLGMSRHLNSDITNRWGASTLCYMHLHTHFLISTTESTWEVGTSLQSSLSLTLLRLGKKKSESVSCSVVFNSLRPYDL